MSEDSEEIDLDVKQHVGNSVLFLIISRLIQLIEKYNWTGLPYEWFRNYLNN